jgi:fumarylpyruvate hydrolase
MHHLSPPPSADASPTSPQYVFTPPALVTVPVVDDPRRFAVRRVFCVGRNFAAHAREMGADARTPPFFFTKPADALVVDGLAPYPSATSDLQHEVEPVIAIGQPATTVSPADAWACIWGYAVGVDLTRRDLQAQAKAAGHPWDMSKGFDHSAPISPLVPVSRLGDHPRKGPITLHVNGQLRQSGDLSEMIWDASETVSHLSHLISLQPGDLIFLGTPAGVSTLAVGDVLTADIAGVASLRVEVTAP